MDLNSTFSSVMGMLNPHDKIVSVSKEFQIRPACLIPWRDLASAQKYPVISSIPLDPLGNSMGIYSRLNRRGKR